MKTVFGSLAAAVVACLSFAAHAQGLPPGSYQQSCRDFRMQGGTLSAVCRRANGRGEQATAINVAHCVGDIGNNNGQLQCNGGQPATPALPRAAQGGGPGYPGPSYPGASYPGQGNPGPGYAPGPGYPGPGYAPPPRYGEEQAYREHCERLRYEEHDLRDRLAYAPYGEERERMQYRLGQLRTERERCWRR